MGEATGQLSSAVIEKIESSALEVYESGRVLGGGVFVGADGLVVSAAHLGPGHRGQWAVMHRDLGLLPASCVGVAVGYDLILLRAELPEGVSSPHCAIAEMVPPATCEVFLYAPPVQQRMLFLKGMVSSRETVVTSFADHGCYLAHYMVHSLSPSRCSGGPWFDRDGRIVGIQLGRINDGNGLASGIGMAATPAAMRELIDAGNDVPCPTIDGIVEALADCTRHRVERFAAGQSGVLVLSIRPGGALDRAGIDADELITAIDGKPITLQSELVLAVHSAPIGYPLELTVVRPGGDERVVDFRSVRLGGG